MKNGGFAYSIIDASSQKSTVRTINEDGTPGDFEYIFEADEFLTAGIYEMEDESIIIAGYALIDSAYHGIVKRISKEGAVLRELTTDAGNIAWLDMARLNDNTFALTGILEGYTGFTVIDGNCNIREDYRFDGRHGYFNSITNTADGGVFLVGNITEDNAYTVYAVKTTSIETYVGVAPLSDMSEQFSLHPNPANNKLTIQFPLPYAAMATLSLYNSMGRPVREYTITNGSNTIDISSLAPGIYLVKLLVNDEIYSNKFIKAE